MRTIDPETFKSYQLAHRERQHRIDQQIQSRFEQAWKVAHMASDLLKNDFRATKVAVFGSLTQRDLFHPHSDVDLAVWGIDERYLFRVIGILQSLDPSISVDLIFYDDASPRMKETIEREGVII